MVFPLLVPSTMQNLNTATLVRNDLTATLVHSSKKDREMQWLTIIINNDPFIQQFEIHTRSRLNV